MTDPTPSPPDHRRSILIAVDAAAPLASLLEAAALFASEWRASLTGLFVEDAELLRAASLPGVYELDISTAAVRPLEAVSLARALRQKAEGMRSALERQAAISQVEWTFRISQGEIIQETLAAAEAELFIVSRAARSFHSIRGQIAGRSSRRVTTGPVLTVYDGSPEAARALAVAARLATLFRTRLVVASSSKQGEEKTALREQCRQLQKNAGLDALIDNRDVSDAPQLLQAARRCNSEWLVIGRHCPLLDEVRLRKLAESLGHPIVLVSAAPTAARDEKTPQ